MNPRAVCLSLLILLASPWAALAQAEPQEPAAEAYLRQARLAAEAGDLARARQLLDACLEHSPDSSEALYLYARTLLAEQAGTLAGIERLRAALTARSWTRTDPQEPATELARALVRARRYAQAREVLAGLAGGPAEPGLGARDNPDAALLWAQTLAGLGDPAGAARHLERSLRRYPADPRLYLHLARALSAQRQSARALEVLGRGRQALPQAPELTLEAARLERERRRRLELLEAYLAQGGRDPAAAALALSLGAREPQAWLARFLEWGGLGRLAPLDDLLAAYRGRPGKEAEALLQALRGFTGTQLLDRDEDGGWEQLCRLEQGRLQEWVLDADQDGQPEAEAQFAAGVPTWARVRGLEYAYSAYPHLDSLTARDERGSRQYVLEPYAVRQELLAGAPPWGPGARPAPLSLALRTGGFLNEEQARLRAHLLQERDGGGAARRFVLQGGQIQRLEQDPLPSGGWAHVVEYAGGSPAQGRKDLDGDGRYELTETYAAGRLSALSVDQDADGRAEFRQQFASSGVVSLWDYNSDGVVDSRETEKADGVVLREFSPALDGTFTAAALFRGERLVEFRRGGRSLPVSAAPGGQLFWLGPAAGSAAAFASLPDGLHTVGGVRCFLFTYRGRRYVERL